jgi:membrane protease YdiL (CAAX protease family)
MFQEKKNHVLNWIFFGAARTRAGWRLLLFFLLSAFLFLLTSFPFFLITRRENIQGDNQWDSLVSSLWTLLFLAVVILASWLMVRFFDKRSFASLGFAFDPGWWREILYGLMAGFFLIGLLFLMGLIIRSYETEWTLHDASIVIWSFVRYILILLIYAAFEEAMFRGYPFQTLMEGIGKTFSIIILSVIFGLLHFFNPNSSIMGVLNTALAGAFLSMLYIKRRSLWLPIFVHFSWNFSMGFLFGLPVSGVRLNNAFLTTNQVGPDLLSGGEFGLEGSLLTSLLLTTLIFILILSDILKPSEEMSKRWQGYFKKGAVRK